MAVLFAWQFFYAAPREQERQARLRRSRPPRPRSSRRPPARLAPQDRTSAQPDRQRHRLRPPRRPTRRRSSRPGRARIDASPRVGIETPSLKGSISLKGGRIDDLVLAKYRETVDPKSPNVELFSPSRRAAPLLRRVRLERRQGRDAADAGPRHALARREGRAADAGVACHAGLGQRPGPGVPAHDLGRPRLPVQRRRRGGEQERQPRLALSLCPDLPARPAEARRRVDDPARGLHRRRRATAASRRSATPTSSRRAARKTYKQTGGWLGFTDKYWAAALVPDPKVAHRGAASAAARARPGAKDTYQADVVGGSASRSRPAPRAASARICSPAPRSSA